MDPSANLIPQNRQTILRKVVLYGAPQEDKQNFDHREESEPVGNPLPQMRLISLNLWFARPDNQNVYLQGLGASFKKLTEDDMFEALDAVSDKIKGSERDYDVVQLDEGEYIRGINVTVAEANGKIGGLEFLTTKRGRKILVQGSVQTAATTGVEERPRDPLPPGETKNFDFSKGTEENFPGYVVGFFGQYDDNNVNYLGVYITSLPEINYYSRRPYILTLKKIQQDKNMLEEISKKLGLEREGERFKNATVSDEEASSKALLYLIDASLTHPELFKAVLEYL